MPKSHWSLPSPTPSIEGHGSSATMTSSWLKVTLWLSLSPVPVAKVVPNAGTHGCQCALNGCQSIFCWGSVQGLINKTSLALMKKDAVLWNLHIFRFVLRWSPGPPPQKAKHKMMPWILAQVIVMSMTSYIGTIWILLRFWSRSLQIQ